MKILFLFLILFLNGAASFSDRVFDLQRVFLESSTPPQDTKEIKVGDKIFFKLSPDVEGNILLDLSTEADIEEKGFLLQVVDAASLNQKMTGSLIQCIPIKVGSLVLPGMRIKDKKEQEIGHTNSYPIQVVSAVRADDPKPTEFEDIEPPLRLSVPGWVLFVLVFLVFLVLIVFGFLLRFYLKKRKSKIQKLPQVVLPEDQIAWNRLVQLEKEDLLSKGQFKFYYFTLSEIIKTYVGARFGFDAVQSTTRELFFELESRQILEDALRVRFRQVFYQLDRVKFSDTIPDAEEPKLLLQELREFIQMTRKKTEVSLYASG